MGVKVGIELISVLESINLRFKKEAKDVSNYVRNGSCLAENSMFSYDGNMIIKGVCDKFKTKYDKNRAGIYVFEIVNQVNIDNTEEGFNATSNSAKIKKGIIGKGKTTFEPKEILYLGKKEKDIANRINEHICLEGTTSSLKLNDANRCHLYQNVRVYAFVLKEEYNNYAKVIVSGVESHLHEILKPLVGTSR